MSKNQTLTVDLSTEKPDKTYFYQVAYYAANPVKYWYFNTVDPNGVIEYYPPENQSNSVKIGYNDNETVNLFSTTGFLRVYKGGVYYGGFTKQMTINLLMKQGDDVFNLTMKVIGEYLEYSPNPLQLKANTFGQSILEGYKDQKIKWSIDILPKKVLNPNEVVCLDPPLSGKFSVDSTGTITVDSISSPGNYTITTNISDRKLLVPISIFDSGYVPNNALINSDIPTEIKTAFLINTTTIKYWRINGQTQTVGVPFIKDKININVDISGTITYSGLTNNDSVRIWKITTSDSSDYDFTINIIGNVKLAYEPNTITLLTGKDGTAKLNSENAVVTSFTVNGGQKYNPNNTFQNDGGTIIVNAKGDITFGGFTKNKIYEIHVTANDQIVQYTIKYVKPKDLEIAGLKGWEWLIIFISIFIVIIIVIAVSVELTKPDSNIGDEVSNET